MVRRKTLEIQDFIVDHVKSHSRDIGRLTAERFAISRPAVAKHLKELMKKGILVAEGATKARQYSLANLLNEFINLEVIPGLAEHEVWRNSVYPLLKDVRENVLNICNYGFTEMLNNVIDHSGSPYASINVQRTAATVELTVMDWGIGIFKKIQNDFTLSDPRHALLELSKGKLTSDARHHTGEGIFFTSRMFDKFMISSGSLAFCRFNKKDDWLFDIVEREPIQGTNVSMEIRVRAEQTSKEIFDRAASELNDYGFTRTHIPLVLWRYEGEQLLSRSQAKRILARVDQFREVFLDFKGVTTIGQAFADEIFRVFKTEHPDVKLIWVNTSPEVEKMIDRVMTDDVLSLPLF